MFHDLLSVSILTPGYSLGGIYIFLGEKLLIAHTSISQFFPRFLLPWFETSPVFFNALRDSYIAAYLITVAWFLFSTGFSFHSPSGRRGSLFSFWWKEKRYLLYNMPANGRKLRKGTRRDYVKMADGVNSALESGSEI